MVFDVHLSTFKTTSISTDSRSGRKRWRCVCVCGVCVWCVCVVCVCGMCVCVCCVRPSVGWVVVLVENTFIVCGPVAQWIRHLTTNQGIPGSSPGRVAFFLPTTIALFSQKHN